MKKLTPSEFADQKREKLLDYKVFEHNFDEPMLGFEMIRDVLADPDVELESTDAYEIMASAKQRAWDSLDFLTNCYSAGYPVDVLAQSYPAIVEYWEVYAKHSKRARESKPGQPSTVAHLPLLGSEYAFANQLICFGILLGHGHLLPRVASIIDYNNPSRDGLLENLLAFYTESRGQAPEECTKHLPYFKTLKIFKADASQRPALMSEYLEDWYEASRREPYYNSHKKGTSFHGYWSWEAAAITHVLKIDDAGYRDAKFYPSDLVEFARATNAPTDSISAQAPEEDLRIKSGQTCPKTGLWESLDLPPLQIRFQEGETVQGPNSAYGVTVWRLVHN